jgi:plasmid stabilization system protein ParE
MARVVWTEPALADLDAIADYVALDDPDAAEQLVQRVFRHVEQLARHPQSGSKPPELEGWRYRQIIEAPCRIFYRYDATRVYILYLMRGERVLRPICKAHGSARRRQCCPPQR